MNTKRSYMESLNAGRARREHATLDDLNRSLASLDERFSRNLHNAERGDDDIALRMRRLSGEVSRGEASDWARSNTPQDFERDRARESGVASMSRIASELNTLREELRSRLEGAAGASGGGEPGPAFSPGVGAAGDGADTGSPASDGHAIAGIVDRLEQIHAAVGNLPDSLSISSLEEKVKTLAGAVEHLARQKEMPGAATFEAIEERLDEISRAIVASSSQPARAFDNEHLERIEARVGSLSRQLEELVEDRPVDAVMKQLSTLSARVEDIAGRAELPDTTVDRLSRQIDLIVEKLEGGSQAIDPNVILEGMERRFETLTQALEQRHDTAREQSVALFRDLEERLERYNQNALSTDAAIVEALNKRFSDLEDAISRHSPNPGAMGLTGHPSEGERPSPESGDIGPRLESIERSLMDSREAIIVAAREAAEQAVRSRSLPDDDVPVLNGLAEELRSLENLARRSDERNTRTFEAIHDTLLRIVDRLGALEGGIPLSGHATAEASARRLEFAEAPSLDMEDAAPLTETTPADEPHVGVSGAIPTGEVVRDPKRSPAEAAAAAAMAALSSSEAVEPKSKTAPKKPRLGKLSRALSRKKRQQEGTEERREPSADPEVAQEAAPDVGLDAPLDPKLANQPLEPGAGAPDLNAIMRRVRDQRGDDDRARDAEAAKSDFIAAARRAAQAAAAEAEVLKKKSDPKKSPRGFSLKRLLSSNTKIVLVAAGVVLVGVAGTQLGKALLKESSQKTATAKAPLTLPSAIAAAKVATAKPDAEKATASMSPIVPLPAAKSDTSAAAAPELKSGEAEPVEDEPAATGSGPMKAAAVDSVSSRDEITVPTADATAAPEKADGAQAAPETDEKAATAASDHPSTSNEPAVQANDNDAEAAASTDASEASAPAAAMSTDTNEDAAVPHGEASLDDGAAPAAMMPVPDDAGPVPLREAAKGGDPKAMFEIGSRFADGQGVKPNMKTAAKWYEQSAELGFAPAEYRIGNFFEKGIGVERDIPKAKDWYKKAAEQGNAAAMHNLGVLYAVGADGPVDNEAAVRWFEKAAELGVKDSQFNLGILAAKGVGMPRNLEESYKWFALVAKTGDKDAAAKRDEVANSLQPEQLRKARAAAELWKAKPVDAAANVVDIPEAWKESDTKTASIDMKQAVRNIQLILHKNGYDAGAPDGIMGDKTKAAIAAFQKANGMEPTGEVNEALVTALLKKK